MLLAICLRALAAERRPAPRLNSWPAGATALLEEEEEEE